MFFYGVDRIYMLILAVGAILSFGATALVKMQFARGKRVPLASGMSGADVARAILRDADIGDVEVVETQGFLADHYNPLNKSLALSVDVYEGTDAAAAGVAAHEVGHAIQHARGYKPMWVRSAIVPVANIGSFIGPWLVVIGIGMGAMHGLGHQLAIAGVMLFGAATAFTLVTVPVEFDASARGRERLAALGIARAGEEQAAVRGVLTAAGLTYVAAAVTALLQLVYWAWRAGLIGNGRRDD